MTDTLRVNEIFGPTIQGEGPAAGRAAMFVRLSGCNLSCSWCDTPYTWDSARYHLDQEHYLATARDIADSLTGGPPLVVLTGGEPLLQQQQPAWSQLLVMLTQWKRCAVHVETNGTIPPTTDSLSKVTQWVLSPKLLNAGPHRGRQSPRIHHGWSRLADDERAVLKFVCTDTDDVSTAVMMADALRWPRSRVWVMPEGTDAVTLSERWEPIVQAATSRGVNASHRLHVLAWGDKRGH